MSTTRDSIRFHYRCFDRILLNGLIQPFQQPERVIGFFDAYRHLYPVSSGTLHGIADRFQQWLKQWSERRNVPVLEAPKGRRDEFVERYFKGAKPDEVVAVLKAREPARIMIAIGDRAANRWHLQFAERWVVQFNFYVNDERWGRMFVRVCPYLPFSARVCLNQHHWLANRMREEGIDFQQCSNAFMRCAKARAPARTGRRAKPSRPRHLRPEVARLLHAVLYRRAEREDAGCHHRLFFAQDRVLRQSRLPSSRRTRQARRAAPSTPIAPSASPTRSRRSSAARFSKLHHGKLQTEIEHMDLRQPGDPQPLSETSSSSNTCAITSSCAPRRATNNVTDYRVRRGLSIICRPCAAPSRQSTTIT